MAEGFADLEQQVSIVSGAHGGAQGREDSRRDDLDIRRQHRSQLLHQVWSIPRRLQLHDDALDDLVVDALEVDLPGRRAVALGIVDVGAGRRGRRVLELDGVALGGRRHGRRLPIVRALDLLRWGVLSSTSSSSVWRRRRRRR